MCVWYFVTLTVTLTLLHRQAQRSRDNDAKTREAAETLEAAKNYCVDATPQERLEWPVHEPLTGLLTTAW